MKAAVAGLVLVLIGAQTMHPAAAGGPRDKFDVNVFVNDSCIVADEPYYLPQEQTNSNRAPDGAKFIPLLGLVVGKLAELFVNHEIQNAVSAMKAKAERRDTRYALTRQMNLYKVDLSSSPDLKLNARLGCMTIVAAKLLADGTDCASKYIPRLLSADSVTLPQEDWQTSRQDDSVENQLRRANICVDGKARAVYEARFEFSKDGTAYRLKDGGYRINDLLTTDDKSARRSSLYTLKITQPGRTNSSDVLSSAWVDLGAVSAGDRSNGGVGDAQWLSVPALSEEGRRAYDERTKVHQQVAGEIDALNRAIIRNRRVVTGLEQRMLGANGDVAKGLARERIKVSVEIESLSAELDARKAEYHDLPSGSIEFMPVTVEVAVTETESAKKSQLALADIIGTNSSLVASTVGSAASSLVSKSISAAGLRLDADAISPQDELRESRDRYFDAWVAVRAATPGDEATAKQLREAKAAYSAARERMGLRPIE